MKYKIEFDRKNCQGCGACLVCENWKFNNDGKVSPIKTELDEIDCNKDVIELCPANVIKIIENEG